MPNPPSRDRSVSVYLPTEVRAAIESRGPRSVSLARIVLRYAEIVRLSRPGLSRTEWVQVYRALEHGSVEPHHLCAQLEHAGSTDLADRLRPLGYLAWVAVLDDAERHWTATTTSE